MDAPIKFPALSKSSDVRLIYLLALSFIAVFAVPKASSKTLAALSLSTLDRK